MPHTPDVNAINDGTASRPRATGRGRRWLCAAALLGWITAAQALTVSGSSTIYPILDKLKAEYAQASAGDALKLSGGGSGKGMKDALSGASDVGMASRDLSAEEQAKLKSKTIALDALAIVVHRSNPIAGLSKAQLVDIYSGKIDNWRALGGPDLKIIRVSKEVGRSTLELFEHYTGLASPDHPNAGGKTQISKHAYIIGANNEALTLVGGMPGAIGYVSFGTAEALQKAGMPVKILPLEQITPSTQTVLNRSYPIVRALNLAWSQETPAVNALLGLINGPKGRAVIESLGFVNLPQP